MLDSNRMYINSTALVGWIAISKYNSFLSILAGVLFVVSQTLIKSNKPLSVTSSRSNASATRLTPALVIPSFGWTNDLTENI